MADLEDSVFATVVEGWLREADEVLASSGSQIFFSRHVDEMFSTYDVGQGIDLALAAFDAVLSRLGARATDYKLVLAFLLFADEEPGTESKPLRDATGSGGIRERIDLYSPPELYLVRRNATTDGFGFHVPDLSERHITPIAVRETPVGGFVVCSCAAMRDVFFYGGSEPFAQSLLLEHFKGFHTHPSIPSSLGDWPFHGQGFGNDLRTIT